jgi:hypothetical protein
MVADTIRCRLDQIPEAEGCPPCCRRLPPGMMMEEPLPGVPASMRPSSPKSAGAFENGDMFAPTDSMPVPTEALPPPQPDELPPLSAAQIPSAEFQFGVVGRSNHVRAMVADGRLRRLPLVDRDQTQPVVQVSTAPTNLFVPLSAHPSSPTATDPERANSPQVTRRLPATEIH